MDFNPITTAVDFTAVIAAVGVIAAAVAGFLIYKRGARELLGFIRR